MNFYCLPPCRESHPWSEEILPFCYNTLSQFSSSRSHQNHVVKACFYFALLRAQNVLHMSWVKSFLPCLVILGGVKSEGWEWVGDQRTPGVLFSFFHSPNLHQGKREESSCKAPAPCCAASHGSKGNRTPDLGPKVLIFLVKMNCFLCKRLTQVFLTVPKNWQDACMKDHPCSGTPRNGPHGNKIHPSLKKLHLPGETQTLLLY